MRRAMDSSRPKSNGRLNPEERMIAEQLDMGKPLIFEISDILTETECAQLIDRIRSTGTELATINTTRGVKIDAQIRNNRRVIFDDAEWANDLLDRVKDRIPQEIHGMILAGANERLRCYEYLPGHRFAPHSDGAFIRNEDERSWYTFIIYLNQEFEGGETVFFVEPEVRIKPKPGAGLFFQHPIIHEGAVVTSGIKYAVRTDLMYRK
jgi:prolyl 4-hydroxylase